MTSPQPLILVIGCGSIGERHVRTFLASGRAAVVACDTRPAIRDQMVERYCVPTVADWVEALKNPALTGVVVATPAPLHVRVALSCLETHRHVLVEKPLSLDLSGVDDLIACRDRVERFAAVAYVLHFAPTIQGARAFLNEGSFGPLRQIAVNTGQYFPFFRPAYREIYYRDREQGGGAIQDALTHVANAVEWIAGPTSQVSCDAAHQVLEGVTVEDTVTASARNGPVLVSYALSQFQAVNETRLDFHAERGSVRIDLTGERWGTWARGDMEWNWRLTPTGERDRLFVAQAHAFLDGCEGKPNLLCTLEEGRQTLRFNLAALQSWKEQRTILI